MELTEKDIQRLKDLLSTIENGTACTYAKKDNIEALKGILEPRCCVCRKEIRDDLTVINGRKMHAKCQKRYKSK